MTEPWETRADRKLDTIPDYDLVPAPPGEDVEPGRLMSGMQEFRFVREGRSTVQDRVDYAIHAAYTTERGGWRTANIVFAYTVAAPGLYVAAALDWALFTRLSRTLIAIPVALALAWLLNQLPLTAWAVPDQWDAGTWLVHDAPVDPGVVELPLEQGAG